MLIYQKIKELCAERNIKVTQMADETGVDRFSMARWDTSSPSISNIAKIADYLKVPLDVFADRKITITNNSGIANNGDHNNFFNDKGKSDMETALLDMFGKLSIMGKIEMLGIAKKLVDDKK